MQENHVTGESVLIVEENGIIAFHLIDILQREGYEVEDPVMSVEYALERLLNPPLPGLVLLDPGLPGRSAGFRKLQQTCSSCNVPVLILTTFSDCPEMGEVPGPVRAGILTMPFSESELRRSVKDILHGARWNPDPGG